ncbi:MAG: hypothetical protein NVSMB17_11340 [Candidatus Dormibacteria bacterium]
MLSHPASAATPDLKHFQLEGTSLAREHARARAETLNVTRTSSGAQLGAGAIAAVWLIGPGVFLALRRWGQRLPRAIRRGSLWLLVAGLLAMGSGLHQSAPSQPAGAVIDRSVATAPLLPPAPAATSTPVASAAATATATATPQTAADWVALVAVESELTRDQAVLAQQEVVIRGTATSPGATPSPVDLPSAPATTDRDVRVNPEFQAERKLARLLDAYHSAAEQYRATLQREYELYRSAAQDPARKEQLVAAAASVPRPEVKDAVAYNLSLVQAQLDQEAMINAAETKLAAIGSLSGSQLGAMRHHQAFIIPVEAPVIQGFGPSDLGFEPTVTYHGTFYPHFHTGLDIVGPENAPVHAAADGVVLLASSSRDAQGHYSGYGNYVVVAHPDGFVTLYGHLNAFSVHEGDVVHQGQILGQEGSTGLSTGPHVHFEIRHNNEWVDPMPYLTGQKST